MHVWQKARPSLELLESRLAPAGLPGFSLVDVSPTSPSSGQLINPANFHDGVSAYYFMDAG